MRAVTLLVAIFAASTAVAAPGWKRVLSEEGITVTSREVPGRGFPTFRGVGVVQANIFDVLAVLSDIKRHTEWMDRCAEARLLRKINEREYIVYTRTDVPWPISDRDSVNRSKVDVDLARREVNVRFWAVRSGLVGPVSGVVRMDRLRGHYKLTALDMTRTKVDYQVDADPGGLLPRWLARLATRRLPLQTIRKLRGQVRRTRGWYRARIKRWLSEAAALASK